MRSDPPVSSAVGRPQTTSAAPTSRRRFLHTVGAAAAALPFVPLLPGVAAGAPAVPAATPPVPAATPPVPAATGPVPAGGGAAAEAEFAADARTLLELVERRFGSRLTAAEKDAVRADLQDGLESGRVLRNLDLANADEPDVVFRARGLED